MIPAIEQYSQSCQNIGSTCIALQAVYLEAIVLHICHAYVIVHSESAACICVRTCQLLHHRHISTHKQWHSLSRDSPYGQRNPGILSWC